MMNMIKMITAKMNNLQLNQIPVYIFQYVNAYHF